MENTEDFPWSAYSNDFEKSVREYIISKQQIYRKKGKGGKEVPKSLMVFSLSKIIHSFQGKGKVSEDQVKPKLQLTRIFNWLNI